APRHGGDVLEAVARPRRGAKAEMSDHVEHDWNSLEYVDRWIARDRARDAMRRPVLQVMLKAAPFAADAALDVLDIAGGYGAVTDEVLRAFPNARVTLHDFSAPMLQRAGERFAASGARVRCAQADLSDPGWTKAVGGPFDLAVSAIAIHNLREMPVM